MCLCVLRVSNNQILKVEISSFQKQPDHTCKRMYSVWNSVLLWVSFSLFSSTAMTNTPISIKLKEEKATRLEGSGVTIQCEYNSPGENQLFWFKDALWNNNDGKFYGMIVYSNTEERPQLPEYSDRVEFFNVNSKWSNCSLKINDLKMNDSGNYSFRYIRQDAKYMSSFFNLKVTENSCKVHIRPPNWNKSLKEGDTVILHCATSAACVSHPKWQPFGSSEVLSIEDKEDHREKWSELKLTLNWKDDGRTLTCRSSESHADHCLDRRVTLRVEYAPKEITVTNMLSSENVKEGEQVRISCSSKAQPNADFTWFKRESSFSWPGETLILNNVAPENAGKYYCQAKNEHGNDTSTDIIINVMFAPKDVNISPTSEKLKEGERLTLTCSVKSSNPSVNPQSFKWYKDGQKVDQTTNVFTKQSVKRSDKGGYQCEARNSVGETKSTDITQVSVEYVPQNTYIEGIHTVKLGLNLNLECLTEADPPANSYSWYFKREHKQQFLMLSHTGQGYSIEEVAVINAGTYKCSAQNVIGRGENSSEINIIVLYSPRKPNLTMKQVVRENELYSITCTVESSPKANLMLRQSSLTNPEKDRKTILTALSNILNFTAKASVQDAGTYTCVAINSEGQNSSNDQLKVLYAPKNVKVSAYPGDELKEGSELKLHCEADSVPEVSAYTWKKSFGTHSVIVGHGQTITLSLLKSSDSDHYFCITSNDMGSAESPTVYIRVKYRPRITITHNMTSLGLLENAVPVHLICSVQSDPPVTLYAWYKLEKNTTVLSTNQNYTVLPQYPGTYYCDASNDVGKSSSEPVKINLNHFIIKWLVQVIISILVILFLICVIFLLKRNSFFCLRKRCLGTNETAQRSFFFSPAPLSSNLRSSGSRNTRENLVMEGSSEISGSRDNHSSTTVYSYSPANRTTQAGRLDYNIHTTYDLLNLPSMLKQHHHQEDLTMTNTNYVQFMDSNDPNRSVHDSCGPVYAKIAKKEQIAKEEQGAQEDYENVSGVCTTKQPFSNMNWDSDSSESEEEVNYTIPSFTATSQKERYSSDEEDKTEYSQVKL